MTQIKKIPTRRCTSCGEHFPKNELFRVVRSPEGEITLDKSGKASGRGAYICKRAECLKKAIRSRRIEASLECKIPDEIYRKLEEDFAFEG
jgi:predicted RNA-binding protein YlxR (DUF448 family)